MWVRPDSSSGGSKLQGEPLDSRCCSSQGHVEGEEMGAAPAWGVGAEVVLEPLLLPRPSHQSLPMAGSFLPRTLLLEISVFCPYVVALQAWHPSPGPASPGLVTHTTQPEQTLPYEPDPGSEKLSPKRKRLIKLVVEVSFLDSKKKK